MKRCFKTENLNDITVFTTPCPFYNSFIGSQCCINCEWNEGICCQEGIAEGSFVYCAHPALESEGGEWVELENKEEEVKLSEDHKIQFMFKEGDGGIEYTTFCPFDVISDHRKVLADVFYPDHIIRVGSLECKSCEYNKHTIRISPCESTGDNLSYVSCSHPVNPEDKGIRIDSGKDIFISGNINFKGFNKETEELYHCDHREECRLSDGCFGKTARPLSFYQDYHPLLKQPESRCLVVNDWVKLIKEEEWYDIGDEFIEPDEGHVLKLISIKKENPSVNRFFGLLDTEDNLVIEWLYFTKKSYSGTRIKKSIFEEKFGKSLLKMLG